MSETLQNSDPTPLFSELIFERLSTRITPAMGFQSYEKLDGDKAERKKQQDAFLTGESYNPTLDYPLLDTQELELMKAPVEILYAQSGFMDDKDAAEAVRSSADYRMKEMTWLQEAKLLNDLAETNPESEDFLLAAERFQSMNERLYGKPNPEIVGQIYGEVFAQAAEKDLDNRGQAILNELLSGGIVKAGNFDVVLPASIGKDKGRLPVIDKEVLSTLAEVMEEDTAFIREITENYWNDVILPRAAKTGEKPAFEVADMKIVFEQALAMMDPEDAAGISVKIIDNKSAISWDTPTLTVEIGASRLGIDDPIEMYARIVHELYTHGGRAIKGLRSGLPVLGTGLYSEADIDKGERSDYLTFEEGIATLSEKAIMGGDPTWKALEINHYLAISLAYDGRDFRETFEVCWRARALMAVKSGEQMTDEIIQKEQKQAWLSMQRTRRGTPTKLRNGPALTFNKDLAYVDGKLIAVGYLKAVGNDKRKVRRLFIAKGDPTNHRQAALVEKYGEEV